MRLIKIRILLLLLLAATPAYCELQSFLALDNAYRWDRISNRVLLSGATVSPKSSSQTLRSLQSYQLGARGQLNFNGRFFARASGHYGWVCSGKYSEGGIFGKSAGHTEDFQASIGKYFCLAEAIWAAPLFGWSYDALLLNGKNIHTAIDGVIYRLNGIKAHQRFNGPFIGFDLNYRINDRYDFTFGYEFHFAHWHGQRLIRGKEYGNPPFGTTTGYSNLRRMDHVHGNVFRLDAASLLCGCWELGLGLKYQFFTGDGGHYRQTKRKVISQYSRKKVDGLWWRSFAATFSIGKTF